MRLGWHFLIPLSIINVLLVGVALIAGAYFHLHGWGLLLVTTPAAILALLAAFLILALEKTARRAPGANRRFGFLCWIRSYFISLPASPLRAPLSW